MLVWLILMVICTNIKHFILFLSLVSGICHLKVISLVHQQNFLYESKHYLMSPSELQNNQELTYEWCFGFLWLCMLQVGDIMTERWVGVETHRFKAGNTVKVSPYFGRDRILVNLICSKQHFQAKEPKTSFVH